LPRLDAIRFDLPVTAAAVGFALATGVVSRLIPLIRLRPAHEGLRSSTSVYAAAAPRARSVLVAAQLALAVVLTTTAVLLGLSLQHIVALDPGFASAHVLSMRVSAYSARYPDRTAVRRFFDETRGRMAGIATVEAVAASSALPLTASNTGTSVGVEGRPMPIAERPSAGWQTVTPGYFAALHIPMLAGRDFMPADLERTTHHTIISQALARRIFGDADPIGRRLTFGPDQTVPDWHEVVGVVGDVRHGSLIDADALRAYDLSGQHWSRTMYVVARTSRDPRAIVPDVRAAVRAVDPEAPVFEVQSLDDIVEGAVSPRRLATGVAIGIALVSLTLAAIGLYGLLASAVAARTKELGIRRALGSPTRAILRLIVGQAAWLAVAGAAAGAAVSLAASRWIETQLFGVRAGDAGALAVIACVLVVVAIAAAYVPARRAGRIDPAIALREE
jgi:predicted permease